MRFRCDKDVVKLVILLVFNPVRMTDIPDEVYLSWLRTISTQSAQTNRNVIAKRLRPMPLIKTVDTKRVAKGGQVSAEGTSEVIVTPMLHFAATGRAYLEADPIPLPRVSDQNAFQSASSRLISVMG